MQHQDGSKRMTGFWKTAYPLLLLGVIALAVLSSTPALAVSDSAPAAQGGEADWLIMVYMNADDNTLEFDLLLDMQEMEVVGSTEDVHIVVQVDRYEGGYDGMEDFTTARRYYVTQDDDPNIIASTFIEDLGEINMGDGDTLTDFIGWAVESYPARKTMLILSGHGLGWPGGYGDPVPDVVGKHDILMRQWFGQDNIWLMELDDALAKSLEETGLEQFDVVGFDACLMAQLEVFTAIAPHARYAVASEELEPGIGWAYAAWLSELVQNPQWEGDDLAKSVVATYIDGDLRPYWDASFRGQMEAEQVASVLFHDTTLSAVDLSAVPAANEALDAFTAALSTIDQGIVARARTYAQAYETVFGEEGPNGEKWPSPFIDLGHFTQIVMQNSNDAGVQSTGLALLDALGNAVIAERHGAGRKGSQGISIYFPVKTMYQFEDNLGYNTIADRFVESTQWDEFLAFHAGGAAVSRPSAPTANPVDLVTAQFPDLLTADDVNVLFEIIDELVGDGLGPEEIAAVLADEADFPQEVVDFVSENNLLQPSPDGAAATASFAKPIKVSPITLSAELAEPGAPINISAEIEGERLGYVYSFIGRFLPWDDVLIVEDQDYIFSETDREVGGVTFPDWPEGGVAVDFDWEPTVYAISDGETSLRILFRPESYGDSPTYSVDGIYHFQDGSPDKYAQLRFRDGELVQIFGFTGSETDGKGAPFEIRWVPGDSVTILEEGINLAAEDEDSDYVWGVGDITFGDVTPYIEETPAPSGNYVVGIIAEDLDGQIYEQYEGLFVVNEEAAAEDGVVPYVNDDLAFALLYPDEWYVDEEDESAIFFGNEDDTAFVIVSRFDIPDAGSLVDASDLALQAAVEELGADAELEALEFGEVEDFVLGAYDGRIVDFAFELDGVPLLGMVVAATPVEGVTYVVLALAQDDVYDDAAPVFDSIFFSFDVLLSGIDRAVAGEAPPALDELIFVDDFSSADSGLYQDEEVEEWGQGYYDLEQELYVFDLAPGSGITYDYYADGELPDSFLYEVVAGYAGSPDNLYGLIFQVVDDQNFYLFQVSGDGYFIVEKATEDGFETLIDWTIGDMIDTGEGGVNVLTVAGEGDVYYLYINGQEVASFSDGSFFGGTVGIVAENFSQEEWATFYFDELAVGIPGQ